MEDRPRDETLPTALFPADLRHLSDTHTHTHTQRSADSQFTQNDTSSTAVIAAAEPAL